MKKLEIYIHIPFCAKKCDYCDFLSMRADEGTKIEYVNGLIREIELSKDMMKGYQVDTVFIGGGTPSILREDYIEKIMQTLKDNCELSENAEITIECNPGTVNLKKLETYKKSGINRISFGLQSANDSELRELGRIHDFAGFVESYKMARQAGFNNINVDLMSALPGQTPESYRDTLNKVIELNPEHISAYSLIVEDGTPMEERVEQNLVTLPDEDTEREMYYLTREIALKNGYKRYEISNYAKAGYECRHNKGYWKRVEYLGFGLGAASLYQNKRYSNVSDLNEYIGLLLDGGNDEDYYGGMVYQDDVWDIQEDTLNILHGKISTLSNKDMMEEFMFLGLRMTEGVSEEKFRMDFGRDIDVVYGEVIEKLEKQNLLERKEGRIKLTDRGVDISNYVMSEFLL